MPPVSPSSARDDAQYLNDEAGMPADSTIAAHCNDRDFGTSRLQLSLNATRNCCGAGGGSWPFASFRGSAAIGRFRGHSDRRRSGYGHAR
jgi:hypothetical protein